MSRSSSPTRARLISAALELFSSQGVTETTTKAIAELAQVNEVTLFRQFGNKQGLLLAVIEDSAVFSHLGETLSRQLAQTTRVDEALKNYASDRLQTLQQIPELLRSVVGEAGQYSLANRQALGKGITQANLAAAHYLATIIERQQLDLRLPAEKLASLLNCILFGYLAIELTSEFHQLWQNQDEFLESLGELFLDGAVSPKVADYRLNQDVASQLPPIQQNINDLPANIVHSILQQAKKQGSQDYALAYILFGAGLRPEEVVNLTKNDQITDAEQHILQIRQGLVRQVSVNQWIMGKRYGSSSRNPLNTWLKSRKDQQSALFLNQQNQPLSLVELTNWWQDLTADTPILIEQAQQTWCVEMLMKGITLEDLSMLSGWEINQLQPFVKRAAQKATLERAIRLDRKN